MLTVDIRKRLSMFRISILEENVPGQYLMRISVGYSHQLRMLIPILNGIWHQYRR